jgi:hypothetical protein
MRVCRWIVSLAGCVVAASALAPSANASAIAPKELAVPARLTCFDLAEPASYREVQGLLRYEWEMRLERGPYVAEREDAGGTYYRAPPGGLSRARSDVPATPPGVGSHMTWDGGLWIPRDPAVPPHQYFYFTTAAVPPVVPPPESNCSNVSVLRDPTTQGVSTITYDIDGAVTGITAGVVARSAGATGVSYGKAATTGAVGGALGGTLAAAIVNMDVGKIVPRDPDKNAEFVAKIRAAAARAVPLPMASASAGSPALAASESAVDSGN